MSWWMRGSVSVADAYILDHTQREHIGAVVKDNLESTRKTKLPFI